KSARSGLRSPQAAACARPIRIFEWHFGNREQPQNESPVFWAVRLIILTRHEGHDGVVKSPLVASFRMCAWSSGGRSRSLRTKPSPSMSAMFLPRAHSAASQVYEDVVTKIPSLTPSAAITPKSSRISFTPTFPDQALHCTSALALAESLP